MLTALLGRKLACFIFLTFATLYSSAGLSQTYPVSIRPPTTLTIDNQAIERGIFNLSGVTAFSDPGGVLTSQIILDPADPTDDVQKNPAIIGSTTTKILVSVPDDSEVLLMEGFFDPVVPDLPIAQFKVILGAISPNGIPEFIWYLPTLTSNPIYTQISSVNGAGLTDNADLFTLLGTTITLTDNDPALPNHHFTPLGNGGLTNNWYVATPDSTIVEGAVPPLPANAVPSQAHGWAGCFGTPPVASMVWAGGTGDWFSSNWDLGYAPDNGTFNCDYRVTVNSGDVSVGASPTVNTLNIGAGAEVDIQNGVTLSIADGLLGNEGTFRFSSTGSTTRLSISKNTSLTGVTGNFIFSPGLSSPMQRLDLNGFSLSTQNGSVHTFTNSARISGVGAGVFGNNGIIRATGGQLEIDSVEFINNGTLETLSAGDEIVLNDSEVTGGILDTANGSKIRAEGATFDNVTNIGTIEIPNSKRAFIENTFSNAGTVQITSTGSTTDLFITDAVALSGTGSIVFSGQNPKLSATDRFISNNGTPDVLTIANGAAQTISGEGEIRGGDQLTIDNNGGLSIGAGPVELDARIENSNGTITVQNGGKMDISGSGRIVGGTLRTQGSGFVEGQGGTLENVSLNGSVKVANGNRLTLETGLSNSGSIEIASTGSGTDLFITDAVALSGTGSITFSGQNPNLSSTDSFISNNGTPDVLTIANGASQTISGEGEIRGGDQLTIANNGGLSIGAGPVDLDARIDNSNGTITVQNGGEMEISGSGRIVGGTLHTQGSGFVEGQGGTLENVSLNGSVKVANGNRLTLETGLSNSGTIEIASTGSGTDLFISDAVALSGTGSIVFSGSNPHVSPTDVYVSDNGTPDILTIANGASQTISGEGEIRALGQTILRSVVVLLPRPKCSRSWFCENR